VTPEDYMRLAIEIAEVGIALRQTPFGAVVVRDGVVLAATHNTVWRDTDPTAHAEVNAIRAAAGRLRQIALTGCVMYSTCEPCPMCLSAIHWAKLDAVYYGAVIADAEAAGFCELAVPAARLAELGGSPLRVLSGPLREECAGLFTKWKVAGLSSPY
jgi:guanine deaminase